MVHCIRAIDNLAESIVIAKVEDRSDHAIYSEDLMADKALDNFLFRVVMHYADQSCDSVLGHAVSFSQKHHSAC